MLRLISLFIFIFILSSTFSQNFTLAIHGGAGRLIPENFTEQRIAVYEQALDSALNIGYQILKDSGTSINACEAVIVYLENNPLFNAGKGAVFNADGRQEMDASIMEGKTQKAGAVAGVNSIKNPIIGAKAVMENSKHVMLSGLGAVKFAKSQKIKLMDSAYFYDENRIRQLKKAKKRDRTLLDHDDSRSSIDLDLEEYKYGTVGAVALDIYGNVAAATSTGGMTNKKYGRIGDSPIIGAGTYANNETCAISCTGHGEYFMRTLAAFDTHALMNYKGYSAKKASEIVIHDRVGKLGGSGGMIVVDKNGNVAFTFNTSGMFRGSIDQNNIKQIGIFK